MNVGSAIRNAGFIIGLGVITIGLFLLYNPTSAAAVPFNLIVGDLAAAMAIILAVWVVRARWGSQLQETPVPDVEYRMASPSPGDEIDSMIYRLTEYGEGTIEFRERIYERLHEITTAVIAHQRGISNEQAEQVLASGEWTDNAVAANYFGGAAHGADDESVLDQFIDKWRSRKSPYERELETVVGAIEEIGDFFEDSELERDDEEEDEFRSMSMSDIRVGGDDSGERVADHVRYLGEFSTFQWTGIIAFALAAIGVGTIASQPALLLAGGLAIGLAGYSQLGPYPGLTDLEVSRSLSEEMPEPGDEVDVTVTVENTGSSLLPDLKLIDQVPPTMTVVDGSPRMGTALRAGNSVTFGYTVVAERGEHDWPLQVVARDVSGAREREALIDTDTTMNCVPRLKTITEMPVRMQTSMFAGGVETRVGGDGLEFFSVRDYMPGDPKRRIDWKTYARTGEFSTIDFREENAARVVLLFDGRQSSYVTHEPGQKHALDKGIDAAIDVFASLNDQGHLIGVAAFNGIPCWLGPSTGQLHLERVRNVFTEHPAISPMPPELTDKDEGRYIDPMIHIRRQLPENTQIFLFSPLTDQYTYEVARRLDGAGHLVTIISPDPSNDRSVGNRIARLERQIRVKYLRDHGIRVVDWDPDENMTLALEYAQRRWGA